MDAIDAASFFLGKSPSGAQNSTSPSETHTITGTATSDSADGLVMVDLEGYTVSADGEQSLELPTTVDVKEGDVVQVTLVGGTGKSPIVTGVVGGGDRLSNNVQDAVQTAQDAADAVAEVADVKNYFFHDTDGAHVTTTPDDATTGKNVLIDADGMDIRDGTTSVAYFHSDGAQMGSADSPHISIGSEDLTLTAAYYDFHGTYQVVDVLTISVDVSGAYLTVQNNLPLYLEANTETSLVGEYVKLCGKYIQVYNENGNQLWTGTAQQLADALKPPIKIQSFSKAVQIGGNAFVSTDLGTINTPTGYTYIGIVADNNGYGDQWLVSYSRYGNKCQAVIHSKYGGTLTSNLYAKAIFLRSDLMS